MEHVARERRPHEALLGVGVVQPADLERDQAGLAQVEGLLDPALLQVPEVEPLPVAAVGHVLDVEAGLVRVGLAELRRDQHVLARLVPEVVVQLGRLAAVLPAALDLERARVEAGEAARAAALAIAEHADHDVVARHAVDGVGAAVAGLLGQLLRLDHLLHERAARIVVHVQDVNARGAEAGHDQVRAVRSVAGRAAAVPAEVVELVPGAGHRRLVDDLAVGIRIGVGVHHGDEVGLVHAGALMEAGEVEEALRWRLGRLRGRRVEGAGLICFGHGRLMDQLAVAVGAGIGVDHRDEVRLVDPGALVQTGEVEKSLGRGLVCLRR